MHPDMRAIPVTAAHFNGLIAHKDMHILITKGQGTEPHGVADPLDRSAEFKECPPELEIEIDPVSFRIRFHPGYSSTSADLSFREWGILCWCHDSSIILYRKFSFEGLY
jgi:hypothetical protein